MLHPREINYRSSYKLRRTIKNKILKKETSVDWEEATFRLPVFTRGAVETNSAHRRLSSPAAKKIK